MMGATSSAFVLGDLALTWSNDSGDADLSLIDSDIAVDRGLETAVLLSLFLDRRAEADDKPPSGDDQDRRGWWADEFAANEGDLIGSRLWLLDRGKNSSETALRLQQYVKEALAWMVEDKVVSSIAVNVERSKSAIAYEVVLQRPGKDAVSFKFAQKWDQQQGSV